MARFGWVGSKAKRAADSLNADSTFSQRPKQVLFRPVKSTNHSSVTAPALLVEVAGLEWRVFCQPERENVSIAGTGFLEVVEVSAV